jgi:hypothetical protein
VQPLVFGLHKHYLDVLRPERKTLRIGEVIDWVLEQLKTPYGIPNMIRLSKETEQPPVSTTSGDYSGKNNGVAQQINESELRDE